MTIIIIITILYNGTHHAQNIIAVHTSATPIMEKVSCSRFEHLFKVGISHHGSPKYTKIDQLAARALRFTSLNKITIKNYVQRLPPWKSWQQHLEHFQPCQHKQAGRPFLCCALAPSCIWVAVTAMMGSLQVEPGSVMVVQPIPTGK